MDYNDDTRNASSILYYILYVHLNFYEGKIRLRFDKRNFENKTSPRYESYKTEDYRSN